jgi:hypothetical protein
VKTFEDAYYVSREAVHEAIRYQTRFNIIHTQSVINVDFVIRKQDAYRIHEFERRHKVEWAGVSLWIVSIEDLILSKLVWLKDSLSEQQQRDVLNLLRQPYERSYVEQWLAPLGAADWYHKLNA